MFKYGKKNGYLAILAIVLAVIPLVTLVFILPTLSDSVAMKVSAAGEVERWGSKYELFTVPVLCLLLCGGTVATGFRKAGEHDSRAMAEMGVRRFTRNAIVTSVVLNVANAYILYMATTGRGIGI